MVAGVTITVEPGLHLHTAEGKAVLAGLGAYNTSKLPPPRHRLVVTAHDAASGDVVGGISLGVDGTVARCFWGAWVGPAVEADREAVLTDLIARASAELHVRGAEVLEVHARAHAPRTAYTAAGFVEVDRIDGHVLEAPYSVLHRPVTSADRLGPASRPLACWEPASKPMGEVLWQGIDAYRQRHIPAPFRWVSTIVRRDGQVAGGALCYAAGTDFMVDMVWLDEALRGTGVGLEMLNKALDAGRALGCTRAGVETMDCQAPRFYPKAGFLPMHRLDMPVQGAAMNFFQMRL